MLTQIILHTTQVVAALPAATGSLTDTANSLIDTLTATLVKSAVGIVLGFVMYKLIKSRFGLVAFIAAAFVGGLFLWFIVGGYSWFQEAVKHQAENTASSVVQVVDNPHSWEV